MARLDASLESIVYTTQNHRLQTSINLYVYTVIYCPLWVVIQQPTPPSDVSKSVSRAGVCPCNCSNKVPQEACIYLAASLAEDTPNNQRLSSRLMYYMRSDGPLP